MIGYFICVVVLGSIFMFLIRCAADYRGVNAFAFASLAALTGGQQNVFLKCVVEILSTTFHGDNQLTFARTYLFIAILVLLAVTQITVLNLGLSRHDQLGYVPVYQASLCIYASAAGGVYFNEFRSFTEYGWSLYLFGLILVASGLLMMTCTNHPISEEEIGIAVECESYASFAPVVEVLPVNTTDMSSAVQINGVKPARDQSDA